MLDYDQLDSPPIIGELTDPFLQSLTRAYVADRVAWWEGSYEITFIDFDRSPQLAWCYHEVIIVKQRDPSLTAHLIFRVTSDTFGNPHVHWRVFGHVDGVITRPDEWKSVHYVLPDLKKE